MLLVASQMILCLVIAFLIGVVVGYLLCKMCNKDSKCAGYETAGKPKAAKKEDVKPDDLKRIKGVGDKIEVALNDLGIYTYAQIAKWNDENVAWVDEYLSFKGRITRDNWVEQAKLLAQGKETEFSQRFDKENKEA